MNQHNKVSKEEKAKIVLTVLRGDKTVNEIATQYSVHPNLITRWKQTATAGLAELFEDKRRKIDRDKYQEQEQLVDRLYRIVGQRDVELDWLKKKLSIFDDGRQTKLGRPRKY
jgi:putative transposase